MVRVGEEDEGEEELTRACMGTLSVVRKAFEVCRPGTTGRAILEYVNRKEAAGDQSMKAFEGNRKPSSVKKYTEVWLKILRYIWRTAAKENRPKYKLTTPLNHIMQQRTYGRRIRESTKASTRVAWAGDMILIDKVAFSIEDIRAVSFRLRETVHKRLFADLLFVSENGGEGEELPPPLQLERIVDDIGCTDEGWSFLTDGRNKFAVDGEEWLAGMCSGRRD